MMKWNMLTMKIKSEVKVNEEFEEKSKKRINPIGMMKRSLTLKTHTHTTVKNCHFINRQDR